jgi:asparagine synthase (glutamine-hydrolysing)
MCGICGFFSTRNESIDSLGHRLEEMTTLLRHRGPDDSEARLFPLDGNAGVVGLGHRRLSIIDLSPAGHQPMGNEDGSLWITYNGEVYNFQDYIPELKEKGHTFRSRSDTEVLLHLYEEDPEGLCEKLRGMFAFAFFDEKQQRLFLARDRLGIKPLYYAVTPDGFAFASEIKSILAFGGALDLSLDIQALDAFLTHEYIFNPMTLFKGIRKLPPGHTLIYEKGRVVTAPYWEIPSETRRDLEEETLKEELVEIFKDAVQMRMISDVPLGVFLSGGVDSSSVVAMMSRASESPIRSFSIRFEDRTYDEGRFVEMVRKRYGTEHTEFVIQPDVLDLLPKLIRHMGDPIGDFSIFPTYLVSKMAREYVTVILSGDGGDELFGGYETYVAQRLSRFLKILPEGMRRKLCAFLAETIPITDKKKGLANYLNRFCEGAALPSALRHVRWMSFWDDKQKETLYTGDVAESLSEGTRACIMRVMDEYRGSDDLNRLFYTDVRSYLTDNILPKVDRMSMATSLEVRVPILDHKLVEWAFSLPGSLKLRGMKETKYIFKKAMASYLPEEILRRPKQGFSIPIKNWLKGPMKNFLMDTLNEQSVREEGIFRWETVNRLIQQHVSGEANHSHRLWGLLVFRLWKNTFFEKGVINH